MKTKVFVLSTISLLSFFNIAFANDSEFCKKDYFIKYYYSATEYCEKACRQNSAEGCRILGELYHHGKAYGIQEDLEQAMTYYKKACGLNDGSACGSVGFFYSSGIGVKEDKEQAKIYYKKACGLNDGSACTSMGLLEVKVKKPAERRPADLLYEVKMKNLKKHAD